MITKTYLKSTYLPAYATVMTVGTVVTVVKVVTVVTVVIVVTVVKLVTVVIKNISFTKKHVS